MNGVLTLSRALARGFSRDRAALFFTVLFPLVFLFLLGGLLGNTGTPRYKVDLVGPVGVYDTLPAAQQARVDQVLRISRTQDLSAAQSDVRNGNIAAAIVQSGPTVTVYYSAADQASAEAVQSVMQSLVGSQDLADAGASSKLRLVGAQVEDKSLREIQYLTPGLLGWAIAAGATFGAASTLVSWRQRRLTRRLMLSPVGIPAVIGARVLVSLVIALAQTVLFVVVAAAFFHLKLAGTWWLCIPLVLAGALAFLAIGLLAGARTKSVEAASAIANLVVIPMAFLAGSFVPLNFAPAWLQTVSEVMPLRHLNDGMLDVLARGDGLSAVLPQLGILLGFALVVTGIAVRMFRWDDV
ncbi:MAG TPA: ABC transporter permease [Actinocrinis sp.]|nr:ABC transporter permease [Actinocrinis sp.]